MSIHFMNLVWRSTGPNAPNGADRLMLLAIADAANDEGRCWPSIARLAEKCGVSERSAKRTVRRLEETGFIAVEEGGGRYHTNVYTVLESAFEALANGDADDTLSKGDTGDTVSTESGDATGKGDADDTVSGKGDADDTKGDADDQKGCRPRHPNHKNPNKNPKGGAREEKFSPPSPEQVRAYAATKKLPDFSAAFVDHFTSNGWKIGGRAPMKDWQAAYRQWCRRQPQFGNGKAAVSGVGLGIGEWA